MARAQGLGAEDVEGVLADPVLAHMWYNIAGANGQDRAQEHRERLESGMTPEDVRHATDLDLRCMESGYEECGS